MRQAGAAYLQEEARYRGARPRVKGVLSPFDLDYGLAPGSGQFVQTVYGGETGKLAMTDGYHTSGSWTSLINQITSPYLDEAMASWETPTGYMDVEIGYRTGSTLDDVSQAAFVPLASGQDISLAPYFQVQVNFRETIRAWALDDAGQADNFSAYAVDQAPDSGFESYASDGPGCLTGFSLAGRLNLPEQEIIAPGALQVELTRDFSELKTASHTLGLDNRLGQWLNRPENAYLQSLDFTQKLLTLYHGWELADGTVSWQLLYQGAVQHLSGMAHGWSQQHRMHLESQDNVAAKLAQILGAPSDTGERRPFMRGTYLATGEKTQTIAAATSEIVRATSGSAVLYLLGTYRGDYPPQNYLIEVDAGGEVGSATFRWSHDQGQSWQKTGLTAGGPDAPMLLENGLSVYWESGEGQDLVTGDRWSFTAYPPIYCYQIFGAPFQAISAVYLDGEIDEDRVSSDPLTGVIQVSGKNAQVQARVVKDQITHPVDIVSDILGELGLNAAINQDSFALAKSLTPEYAIGVKFENITSAQAIREIIRRCLYDLWIDFGEIKISAYLGENS
jgi:hypothetical protein